MLAPFPQVSHVFALLRPLQHIGGSTALPTCREIADLYYFCIFTVAASMTPNAFLVLFGQHFDPIALAALAFAFLVVVLFIVMVTFVARRSANDAWEAVHRTPKAVRRRSLLLLPTSSLPSDSRLPPARGPMSNRKSAGSLTIMTSIAEEPNVHTSTPTPVSSASASDDWVYLEVPHESSKATSREKSKRQREFQSIKLLGSNPKNTSHTPTEKWW